MLYLFVIAVGLLAPWINRVRRSNVLAPVLGTVWGPSGIPGDLPTCRDENARGMAAVLTALVLSVGLGGSVWFLQNNLERQTLAQSRDGLLAQHALVSPAVVCLTRTVDEAAEDPRVCEAATSVRRTSVRHQVRTASRRRSAAQAVDATDTRVPTMDLRVRSRATSPT